MDLMVIPSWSRSPKAAARCEGVLTLALKYFGHENGAYTCAAYCWQATSAVWRTWRMHAT
eukprot:365890-Chlamydomonas_euryale.AAC.6